VIIKSVQLEHQHQHGNGHQHQASSKSSVSPKDTKISRGDTKAEDGGGGAYIDASVDDGAAAAVAGAADAAAAATDVQNETNTANSGRKSRERSRASSRTESTDKACFDKFNSINRQQLKVCRVFHFIDHGERACRQP
jgi:hypothetical protein